jgi:RNA polymerase-binding transcription factor DksA
VSTDLGDTRQQMQRITTHVADRIMLLNRPEQHRAELGTIADALIWACDDPQKVSDEILERLLVHTQDADEMRRLITVILTRTITADRRSFQEFTDLLTAALLLERSSLGTGAAWRLRTTTEPSQISAVVQLASMLEQADRSRRDADQLTPPQAARRGDRRHVFRTGTSVDTSLARKRLEEIHDELDRTIEILAEEVLHRSQTFGSSADPADTSPRPPKLDRTLTVLQAARSQRSQVLNALNRLDNGKYGTCTECGKLISARRLDARPEAARCIACQSKAERRRR